MSISFDPSSDFQIESFFVLSVQSEGNKKWYSNKKINLKSINIMILPLVALTSQKAFSLEH